MLDRPYIVVHVSTSLLRLISAQVRGDGYVWLRYETLPGERGTEEGKETPA